MNSRSVGILLEDSDRGNSARQVESLAGNFPRRVTLAVQHRPDDRSPMAKAMDTASRIIAICLEMVVPGLGGYWLDQKLNTEPWLALLGFVLGAVLATLQLIRMTSHAGGQKKSNPPQPPDVTPDQDQTP